MGQMIVSSVEAHILQAHLPIDVTDVMRQIKNNVVFVVVNDQVYNDRATTRERKTVKKMVKSRSNERKTNESTQSTHTHAQ